MELIDHRLTMLLTEQPQIFGESKVLLGASKGGVGLINRFHVAMSSGLPAGGAALHRIGLSDSLGSRYAQQVGHLLERSICQVQNKSERPALRLSPGATDYFVRLRDEIQQIQSRTSGLDRVAEYASRHSERVLRLAGCIHAFEHAAESEIQLSTMQAADQVGRWGLDAFLHLTYEPPKLTQAQQDVQIIDQAFSRLVSTTGHTIFVLSDLRRCTANIGLTKSRFDRALPILADQGKVTVQAKGRTDLIRVNPVLRPLIQY